MNQQIITKNELPLDNMINEISNIQIMVSKLLQTKHYASLGEAGIFAIIQKAKSLNMDPIEALNGSLYYVQGKVGMSAEAMAARMRAAGHSITKDPKSTPTNCILNGKRGDNGDLWQVSFSIDDAKRAGIYNERGPWGKYPQMMCYNRAISMLYRQLTPDLSKGIGYEVDEIKEIVSQDKIQPMPMQEVEIKEVVKTITMQQADELISLLSNCSSEYTRKLWDTLSKPPISIQNISLLPVDLFDRIKNAALNNQKKVIDPEENADLEDRLEEALEASS